MKKLRNIRFLQDVRDVENLDNFLPRRVLLLCARVCVSQDAMRMLGCI